MSGRTRAVALAGVVAVAAGLGWGLWQSGAVVPPGPAVMLADATASQVDTVSLTGRRVEASLDGRVIAVPTADRVALGLPDGRVALHFDGPAGVEPGDRVLAVGRVLPRPGRRVVAVRAWSRVRTAARPPAAAGL